MALPELSEEIPRPADSKPRESAFTVLGPEHAIPDLHVVHEHLADDTTPRTRPASKAIFVLDAPSLDVVYGAEEQRDLSRLVDFCGAPQTRESIQGNLPILAEAEIMLTSWGAPRLDHAFLEAAPKLRAVFHAAGSIRSFITPASWQRGIVVTCAANCNADPVADYTLAAILLGLRSFWRFAAGTRQGLGWGDHTRAIAGGYQSTVGLVSCGVIARKVLSRLASHDVKCIVYDPFVSEEDAAALGVELCSLEEVFSRADVVSLHTPELPGTRGMITGKLLGSMKPNATFINTARGAVVREAEMIETLWRRPDLQAVLDVCDPEPPAPDSPLLHLPNVVLTPHIAGSMGMECRRLGRCMVEEVRRYLAGEPLHWQVTEAEAARLA
jgi:phosphoglycerate dehydrogenase-like enzyme